MDFTTDDYDTEFGQPRKPANWPDISPATRQGPAWPDVWRLVNIEDTPWQQDDSGITCLITWRLATDIVRIDLMSSDDGNGSPIISFQGDADDVRKYTMAWLAIYVPTFALDHAAYIGAELERADTERIDYVQDGKALDAIDQEHADEAEEQAQIDTEAMVPYNKCDDCLTAGSQQDTSEICLKCDKPDVI